MRRLVLCMAVLAITSGCGRHARVNQTYSEGENPLGEPEETYGTDVSLTSPDQAALEHAEALARQQDFEQATQVLQRLVDHADRDVREGALYELGQVQGNLLNPARDYDAAIATLQRLLTDFPQSKLRLRAEQAIAQFQGFQAHAPDQ